MTEFKFSCPQCSQNIQCDTSYAGTQINCPACKQAIIVPPAPPPPLRQPGASAPDAGRQSSSTLAAQPPAPAKSHTVRNVLIIAVVALFVLAGLVTGLWFGYSKFKVRSGGQHLIGWWKLDDGSGTVARDSSRGFNGNNGKLVGNPKWVKGRSGNTPRFSGGQRVDLGDIYQDAYDEISIACWIKHPSTGWQSIVERSVWDNPDGIGLWADYSGAAASFGHYGTGYVKSNTKVQDNRWHHLVGTMAKSGDNYIYSIYVDGKLDNTMTNSTGLTPTSNPWSIGARFDGSWAYRGLVEDVRIYDRALSASEIQAIYSGQNNSE